MLGVVPRQRVAYRMFECPQQPSQQILGSLVRILLSLDRHLISVGWLEKTDMTRFFLADGQAFVKSLRGPIDIIAST